MELSGIVEATGGAVRRFGVGDAVLAASPFRLGAYAEYICLPDNAPSVKRGLVAKKPSNMSFEEAAAGLATGGLHPVVCVYATFLNRAFDQVLMDVALHRLPVTFVLDRAGVTGDDGASHNGMWDLSILSVVPGLRVAAPRDATRLRQLLREAVEHDAGPTAVRFPKASVGDEDIDGIDRVGGMDVLRRDEGADVLIVGVGALAPLALDVAERVSAQGLPVTVVDPRWVLPVDASLPALAAAHSLVVVIEDNGRVGGVGDAVARELRSRRVDVDVATFGLPQEFLPVGKRASILRQSGLSAQEIARAVVAAASTRLVSSCPADLFVIMAFP
jgi:1-deoxy-D-xylulose-5-phosphate synthase